MAAKHSRAATVEYVASLLKNKAEMTYSEVLKAARSAGHLVYPIIMRLAKKKLGLGKQKRRPAKGDRKPGRPAGTPRGGRPVGGGRDLTSDLVRAIDRLQRETDAMRGALRQIGKLAARF